MENRIRKQIINSAIILFGCFLYSASLSLFLSPAEMAPGGVSGLAIILNYLFPVSVGILTFVINIPLFVLGFAKLGRSFMIHTISATAIASVMMEIMDHFAAAGVITVPLSSEPILTSLTGGALCGAGIGFIMKAGGSTGGTDIIARVLRRKYKHIKTGTFFILLDAGIIFASAIVFQNINAALFASIADIVTSIIMDKVLYGADEAKLLMIVSKKEEAICCRIMDELEAGATYLEGTGAYTGDERKVIMCTLHKSQFTKAREIIREVDPEAFLIITTASEVFGEGYKAHFGDEL